MKVALIGGTGNVGSKILAEALERGHEVTVIVRHPDKLAPRPRLSARAGDVNDAAALAPLLAGHDAAISAVRFQATDPAAVLGALKQAGLKRLLVVGGAGTLRNAAGTELVDAPGFPEIAKPEALAGRRFLAALRAETALDWSFLSPSMVIAPGTRTGRFRLGTDDLLVEAGGQSRISQEDFAVAMIDELETPRHIRQRFTVGY